MVHSIILIRDHGSDVYIGMAFVNHNKLLCTVEGHQIVFLFLGMHACTCRDNLDRN